MSEGVRSVEGMETQNKVSTLGPLPVLDPSAPTTSTVPTIVVPPTVALLTEQASVLAAHVDYLARAVSIVRAEPSELDQVGAAFEHLGRTIGVAQVRLVARMEVAIEDLKNSMSFGPKRSKYRSTQDRLSQVLHINPADVTARLTVAHATFNKPETLMTDLNTDVPLPSPETDTEDVSHPMVGAAFHAGEIAVPVSSKIIHAVDRLRPIIHQFSVTEEAAHEFSTQVETSLVQTAKTLTPKDVDKAIKDWEHELNAKGVLPTREARREFQGAFYKGKKMGLFEWTIRLDELQQESLLTAIAPEVNPRTKDHDPSMPLLDVDGNAIPTVLDEHGKVVEPPKDDRNYGQKRLDGLIHAINVALTTGKVSRHGGYQPQIMVNIDHKTLEADLLSLASCPVEGSAYGQHADGSPTQNRFGLNPAFRSDAVHSGPINPIMIRRLACNAELLPIVLGSDSQILDAGNRARLFSAEQRKLMYARDRGCTFPNCKQGVDRCEAHHVHEYSRGGETTLENGAMVCSHHHHLVHETDWRIHVKNGVPYWVAPLEEDPNQRLLRNVYFHPEKIGQLPIAA